ncbi:fibulin-1-like [Anneissia japonica]|uniref:fibulin-1-like n=1 Tax=Anneissia japonica TaxID=1529436 RepID=UPI001425B903|nr:fibulin-1-like [Anneissia japonica]
MMHRFGHLLVVFGLFMNYGEGKEASAIQSIMTRCCSLGEEFGTTNLHCESYDNVVGIAESDRISCENIFSSCCRRSLEVTYCDRGISDYKQIETCVYAGILSSSCYNIQDEQCCKCCRLGTEAREQGMDCNADIPDLGTLCRRAFMSCCVDGAAGNIPDPTATTINGMNECLAPGVCQHRCIDTPDSYRCECNPGYILQSDRITCVPVNGDRCSTSPCEHQCTDTGDRVICTCDAGYILQSDGRSCSDIDECQDSRTCQLGETCINEVGSFRCERSSFFSDINECVQNINACSQGSRCENSPGSYKCTRITPCGTGYTVNALTQLCDDIDECALGTHTCTVKERCINYRGRFRCENCRRGFKVDGSNQCTIDINECEEEANACRSNTICQNTIGGYQCRRRCPTGYKYDEVGQNCVDVDECAEQTHNCLVGQNCVNRQGSFSCQCPQGYTANRITGRCEDVDECQRRVCQHKCTNTPGSFQCSCNDGFELNTDGRTCKDRDECSISSPCQQRCMNTYGSYRCYCERGYRTREDGSCVDNDECSLFAGRGRLCGGICYNTLGSYECRCPAGYILQSDRRTCKDKDECALGLDNCGSEHTCFNIGGSFKCNYVQCPPYFTKDNSKCIRRLCAIDDPVCISQPTSITYTYLSWYSLPTVPAMVYRLTATPQAGYTYEFTLNKGNERGEFDLRAVYNVGTLNMITSIMGPREIELELELKMFYMDTLRGRNIARIFLYISKYNYAGYGDVQRCIRNLAACPQGDVSCLLNKTSVISYNYLALPSIPALRPGNQIRLISMQPTSLSSTSAVYYQILSGNEHTYFAVIKAGTIGTLYLVKAVEGPYETEIKLEMSTYNRAMALVYRSIAVIKIHVSEYDFM